ncbi:hypothetical protein KQX54_011133 [Cotesia glomerata]|uniref:Uncharacterized protein n=1 Tax=Cotesia glomerata TaxID=32391 RepID=A0AAV7J5W4_COTGL|nr:hypothetical protein KQX54_011133 [Cotesia glomerata]
MAFFKAANFLKRKVYSSLYITLSTTHHLVMNADEFVRIFGLLPTPPSEDAEVAMDLEKDLLNRSEGIGNRVNLGVALRRPFVYNPVHCTHLETRLPRLWVR